MLCILSIRAYEYSHLYTVDGARLSLPRFQRGVMRHRGQTSLLRALRTVAVSLAVSLSTVVWCHGSMLHPTDSSYITVGLIAMTPLLDCHRHGAEDVCFCRSCRRRRYRLGAASAENQVGGRRGVKDAILSLKPRRGYYQRLASMAEEFDTHFAVFGAG